MSKGSARRPTEISEELFEDRWSRTFSTRQQEKDDASEGEAYDQARELEERSPERDSV